MRYSSHKKTTHPLASSLMIQNHEQKPLKLPCATNLFVIYCYCVFIVSTSCLWWGRYLFTLVLLLHWCQKWLSNPRQATLNCGNEWLVPDSSCRSDHVVWPRAACSDSFKTLSWYSWHFFLKKHFFPTRNLFWHFIFCGTRLYPKQGSAHPI